MIVARYTRVRGSPIVSQPDTAFSRQMRFDMICEANDVEHCLTKPNHFWTNGQIERMKRTIKEATGKRFRYDRHDQLRAHLADFMRPTISLDAETLSGLTPYECIAKIWAS